VGIVAGDKGDADLEPARHFPLQSLVETPQQAAAALGPVDAHRTVIECLAGAQRPALVADAIKTLQHLGKHRRAMVKVAAGTAQVAQDRSGIARDDDPWIHRHLGNLSGRKLRGKKAFPALLERKIRDVVGRLEPQDPRKILRHRPSECHG